jgi:hypothetical protein
VISQHPFLRLLQAFAVLLPFAAAPAAAGGPWTQGAFAEITRIAAARSLAVDDPTDERRPDPAVATAQLDIDDKKVLDSGSGAIPGPAAVACASLGVVHPSHRVPAPTHRSCAAPPTGPPHA